jgi:polar amino acid transport system substrate-binding protein
MPGQTVLQLAFAGLCWGAMAVAAAACSRPIVVPASPLGRMIEVDPVRGTAWGIYPDLLRAYGARAGCVLVFPVMPRARAEVLLRNGEADLLLGAVKVSERDAWGEFMPMLNSEWVLISRGGGAAPRSVQALLDQRHIMFNAVRGFNAGPAYLDLLAGLERRGALEYVNDAQTIVRKMAAGRVDYTVMPSHTFAGALGEVAPQPALTVRYSRLEGLPPAVIGVYLAKTLAPADAAALRALLLQIRAADGLMIGLRRYFTPDEMASSYALAPTLTPAAAAAPAPAPTWTPPLVPPPSGQGVR